MKIPVINARGTPGQVQTGAMGSPASPMGRALQGFGQQLYTSAQELQQTADANDEAVKKKEDERWKLELEAHELQGKNERAGAVLQAQIDQAAQNKAAAEAQALTKVNLTLTLKEQEQLRTQWGDELDGEIKAGRLTPQQAQEEYSKRVTSFTPAVPEGVDEVQLTTLNGGLQAMDRTVGYRFQSTGKDTQVRQGQDNFNRLWQTVIDEAQKPGASPVKAEQQLRALRETAPNLGFTDLAALDKRLGQAVQDIYGGRLQTMIMQNETQPERLAALEKDLNNPDGLLGQKLTQDQRNRALSQIQTARERMQRQTEMAQRQREQAAQEAVREREQGVQTGAATSAEQVNKLEQIAAADPNAAAQMQKLGKVEGDIQRFRQMSVTQQAAWIKGWQQHVRNNPAADPVTQEKMFKMAEAVFSQRQKLAKDSPLEYLTDLGGQQFKPIDLTGVVRGQGVGDIQKTVSQRISAIRAQQKVDGLNLSSVPFLPQEIDTLKQVMARSNNNDKLTFLSGLADAVRDPEAYRMTLEQLSGDRPEYKLAGLYRMGQKRGNGTSDQRDLGAAVLNGAEIMRNNTIPLPPASQIAASFQKELGGALDPNSQQYQDQVRAAQYLYASLAAEAGVQFKTGGMPDKDVMKKVMTFSTGGLYKGNGFTAIKPWGWQDSRFLQGWNNGLAGLASHFQVPVDDLRDYDLRNVPGKTGRYELIHPDTRRPVVIKNSRLIIEMK